MTKPESNRNPTRKYQKELEQEPIRADEHLRAEREDERRDREQRDRQNQQN